VVIKFIQRVEPQARDRFWARKVDRREIQERLDADSTPCGGARLFPNEPEIRPESGCALSSKDLKGFLDLFNDLCVELAGSL